MREEPKMDPLNRMFLTLYKISRLTTFLVMMFSLVYLFYTALTGGEFVQYLVWTLIWVVSTLTNYFLTKE